MLHHSMTCHDTLQYTTSYYHTTLVSVLRALPTSTRRMRYAVQQSVTGFSARITYTYARHTYCGDAQVWHILSLVLIHPLFIGDDLTARPAGYISSIYSAVVNKASAQMLLVVYHRSITGGGAGYLLH